MAIIMLMVMVSGVNFEVIGQSQIVNRDFTLRAFTSYHVMCSYDKNHNGYYQGYDYGYYCYNIKDIFRCVDNENFKDIRVVVCTELIAHDVFCPKRDIDIIKIK